MDDSELVHKEMWIPRDKRRVFCLACQENESTDAEQTQWFCQRIMDIEPDLRVRLKFTLIEISHRDLLLKTFSFRDT